MRSAAAAVRERDKINESAKDGLNSFVSFLSARLLCTPHFYNCLPELCCVRNHSIFGLCIIRWVLEFQAHVDPTIFIGCCFFCGGDYGGFSGRYSVVVYWVVEVFGDTPTDHPFNYNLSKLGVGFINPLLYAHNSALCP